MTLWSAFLIILGLVVVLVLTCALWVLIDKKVAFRKTSANVVNGGYDERQIVLHGRASSVCVLVLSVYYGCVALYLMLCETQYLIDPAVLVGAGLGIGIMAYYFYCLMTDSVLPLNKNAVVSGSGFVVGGILTLLGSVVRNIGQEVPMIDNKFDWFTFVYGVYNIVIGVVYWIAHIRDKRASDEQ